ncbi:two-component sensor histidine kinase [Rossellomorea vietnamensis]|uniref:histidine kinase n=1 Tax=Rossellomorea vietnamensis TaxID=218284 RepID=A0A5D4MDX8_9BACI|nr:two-component sensor histidine kinase [Rossellomorea vietnamensis]
MNQRPNHIQLDNEEIKTLKLFLPLFYFLLIGYDLFYYYIFKYYEDKKMGLPEDGMGYWFHLILILILPLSIYLTKKGKVYTVKYIYLAGFILVDLVNNLLIYAGSDKAFNSGHILEILFILFSPIFINKRFFWSSTIGMILLYVVFGVTLNAVQVVLPIAVYIILSAISYMFLSRFYSNLEVRLKLNDELRHAEKLAAVGRFATSISHEVRNPLASLKGFTQLQHEKHPEDGEYYSIMINEIERISSLLDDLLVIGKPKGMNFELHDLNEVIDYVLKVMDSDAKNQGIQFIKETDTGLPMLECDAKHLKQVLINLIKNGMESMPLGGEVAIQAEVLDAETVKLTIKDGGQGISKENLAHLGTPFHTTKADGTGLGLMVSFKIIEEHNGAIDYESEEGKGTAVSVSLPVKQPKY